MSDINQEILDWLVNTPPSDGNFKQCLKEANSDTVQAAIDFVKEQPANKVKLRALTTRLEQCLDGLVEVNNRQSRGLAMDVETLRAEREADQTRTAEQAEREKRIAECHEVIGRIQGVGMISKMATVASLVWLKEMKEVKIYRDLPNVGSWDNFCKYLGKDRRTVDEDLQNLAIFGENFLETVASLRVGYRDLRKLRQLAHDGVVQVEDDAITIGAETIPLDADHRDDLHVAIERIIEQNTALSSRVERLEKNKDEVVKEETKGLKAEVGALVKEVKRLQAFDPEGKDREWSVGQMAAIRKYCDDFSLAASKVIIDPRVKDDRQLQTQIHAHIMEAELTLKDLRDRLEAEYDIYGD